MMDKHRSHDDRQLSEEHGVEDFRDGMPAAPPVEEELAHIHAGPGRTLWGDAWHRLRRNRLALVSLVWLLIVVIATVTADLWVPPLFGDPTTIDSTTAAAMRLQGPSAHHLLGTDDLGRD